MACSRELGAHAWLATVQASSACVSQVVAKLRSVAAERIVPSISWIHRMRHLLEVTWGLEEGPPPHLDAIIGSPRLDDLMRHYYDKLEKGQGLCATLEDLCYDDDDDTTEDANSINLNIDCKDNGNLTYMAVNLNNNNNNDKSNNNNDDNNDCGDNNNDSNDNNKISNNISNDDDNNNNNNNNDNNNNNNNNDDDCDLRDDGDDICIQVIQVIATDNNDHFVGCEVNIYNSDSDGSGRWVQRAPTTIFVIFSGGWFFGRGSLSACSRAVRAGEIALRSFSGIRVGGSQGRTAALGAPHLPICAI
ncbi:hypothetical protein CBR_g57026 [Chara braunii]|uniref:Uncharacterized protein n=1 Tax=Chara braunii TaxID=69332 RepID=A0A388K7V8_CHABU|nr:hypothetical protein CBR_g57026 [Chara braunii]|eukprot:GBG66144.1 hypothetical protein CBR_g57026 [Chara braunii]